MSTLEKPAKTWHEIARELISAQDPEEMIRLAVDLESAFERDEANRHRRSNGSESTRGTA
jgi:hypothetical protein